MEESKGRPRNYPNRIRKNLKGADLELLLYGVMVKINQTRKVLELPPLRTIPTGAPGDGTHCALAHALHAEVTSHTASWEFSKDQMAAAGAWGLNPKLYKHMEPVPLPLVLREFVHYFDRKMYPSLLIIRCRQRHWEHGDLD